LQRLPGGFRWLKRNLRQDVIDYLEAFASLLEDKLLQHISIPNSILTDGSPATRVQPVFA